MSQGPLPVGNPLSEETRSSPGESIVPAFVIALTSFLVTFDITAVVVVMPRIKSELGLDVSGFAWVMDAYSLAFTVLLMAAGVLADRYGRRRALLFGNLVFAGASLACGLSWNDVSLWSARAVQGLGAAFVICGGLALLSDHYRQQQERVKAFALAGTVSGAAMALGPSLGGLLADLMGWRWVFFINLPVCALIALAVPRATRESRDPTNRRVDLAGLATLTLTLLSLIWLLLHGPVLAGIKLPALLACAVILACFAAFITSQRLQKVPMIDMSLFSSSAFLAICLVPLALSVAFWATLVYLPLFLQTSLGQPLGHVSVLMLASTLPMLVLPLWGGAMAQRLQPRTFFSLGLAVVAIGSSALAIAAAMGSLALALLGMVISGSGTAIVNSQVSGAIVALAPRERAGTVSAIATILRQGGFAAGIAMLGALLNWQEATGEPQATQYALLFGVVGACSLLAAVAVLVLLKAPESVTQS